MTRGPYVLAGPSGVGKGKVRKEFHSRDLDLVEPVSYTTRSMRCDEVNGRDYHFITEEEFRELVLRDFFAEWATFDKGSYGTPRDRLESMLEEGKRVMLEIDLQGARQIKQTFREAVVIFVYPPPKMAMKVLKERLEGRGDSEEGVRRRLIAGRADLLASPEVADFYVINDEVRRAANGVEHIIRSVESGRRDALRLHSNPAGVLEMMMFRDPSLRELAPV